MADCPHALAYQRQLETEHFILVIMRCRACDEFLKLDTTAKKIV